VGGNEAGWGAVVESQIIRKPQVNGSNPFGGSTPMFSIFQKAMTIHPYKKTFRSCTVGNPVDVMYLGHHSGAIYASLL
jgi:hypothetical protein